MSAMRDRSDAILDIFLTACADEKRTPPAYLEHAILTQFTETRSTQTHIRSKPASFFSRYFHFSPAYWLQAGLLAASLALGVSVGQVGALPWPSFAQTGTVQILAELMPPDPFNAMRPLNQISNTLSK